MRLFVAVELDDAARRAIADEQSRLKVALEERSRLTWVRAQHIHLTLAFLGEVSEDRGRLAVKAMSRPIDHDPFAVGFGGLGVFPHQGPPRVLWLGLKRGAREVHAVQQQVVERLAAVGFATEKRAFHPHLTLGRWRESREIERHRVPGADRPGEVAVVDVVDVALVQSRMSSDGPTHTTLCLARLVEHAPPTLQSRT